MLKCNKKRVFYMKVRKKPIVVNAEQATKKVVLKRLKAQCIITKAITL